MRAPISLIWPPFILDLKCLDTCCFNPQTRDPKSHVTIDVVSLTLNSQDLIGR